MASEKTAPDPEQPAFDLRLPESALFSLERFYPGNRNRLAFDAAKSFATGALASVLVITGKPKSGKSHLLKGICHNWKGAGNPFFLSVRKLAEREYDGLNAIIHGAEKAGLACIDDLDFPGAPKEFYDMVFSLFNILASNGGFLGVAMRTSPAKCPGLPDYLSTRLLTGMVVTLALPDEEEKRAILKKIAADRNMALTPQAIQYILNRNSRSVGDLLELVGRLEKNLNPGTKRIGLQLLKRVINSFCDDLSQRKGSGE